MRGPLMARTASDETTGGARPVAPTMSAPARTCAEPLTSSMAALTRSRRSSGAPVNGRSTNTVEMRFPARPRPPPCAPTPARAPRRVSGAPAPRKRDSISATTVSSTSFTVAPVARRTALISSSVQRASANTAVAADGGVQARLRGLGADARQLAGQRRRACAAGWRTCAGPWCASRPRAPGCAAAPAVPRPAGSAPPAGRRGRAARARCAARAAGCPGRSGSGSRITVLTSTAAMPSTSAWCILATIAERPRRQALDQRQLPQRPGAVERLGEELAGQLAQLGVSSGRREGHAPDVAIGVEGVVVDPAGLARPSGASSRRIA